MIPESKLIRNEFTIREMSFPEDVKLARKSLIRWLALSLGLIYPNESRQLLLDILDALFYFHVKKDTPTTRSIIKRLEEITGKQQNPKAIYYHLLKLKNMGIVTRKKGGYYFGNGEEKKLSQIFREFYISKIHETFKNIEEAFNKLESNYGL